MEDNVQLIVIVYSVNILFDFFYDQVSPVKLYLVVLAVAENYTQFHFNTKNIK